MLHHGLLAAVSFRPGDNFSHRMSILATNFTKRSLITLALQRAAMHIRPAHLLSGICS